MFKSNKFDLIISIGEDCACTSYLRRLNLQTFSYPFDWLTNGPFENRIDLIINDFENFLNYEDLKIMEKPTAFPSDENHDYYENVYTKLYYWHDFPAGEIFDNSYNAVKEKYDKRIKRLYKNIKTSKRILFVWLSHSKNHSNDEFINAYNKLKQKFYDKQIYILAIENSTKYNTFKTEDGHVIVIRQDTASDDKIHPFNLTMGNQTNNLNIISKLKLKTNIRTKIKRLLYSIIKLLINIIPSKSSRHKYREKLRIKFNHAKL